MSLNESIVEDAALECFLVCSAMQEYGGRGGGPTSPRLRPKRMGNTVVEDLQEIFDNEKVVAWKDCDSAKVRMCTHARLSLRNYGYPATIRNRVVDQLLQSLIDQEIRMEEETTKYGDDS